jgi:hypothetical protein
MGSVVRYGRDVESRTETQSIEGEAANPGIMVMMVPDPSRIPDRNSSSSMGGAATNLGAEMET